MTFVWGTLILIGGIMLLPVLAFVLVLFLDWQTSKSIDKPVKSADPPKTSSGFWRCAGCQKWNMVEAKFCRRCGI